MISLLIPELDLCKLSINLPPLPDLMIQENDCNIYFYILKQDLSIFISFRQVALNGKTLQLIDDHTLPQLVPVQQSASRGIMFPPLSLGFFVFPDASAAACK